MDCTRCNEPNPDDNNFCGKCGASLDPRTIADQDLVEYQLTERVAERLIKWAKVMAFVVSAIVVTLVGILGFVGINSLSDIIDKAELFKADSEQFKAETEKLKAETEKLKAEAEQFTEETAELFLAAEREVGLTLDKVKIQADAVIVEVNRLSAEVRVEADQLANEFSKDFETVEVALARQEAATERNVALTLEKIDEVNRRAEELGKSVERVEVAQYTQDGRFSILTLGTPEIDGSFLVINKCFKDAEIPEGGVAQLVLPTPLGDPPIEGLDTEAGLKAIELKAFEEGLTPAIGAILFHFSSIDGRNRYEVRQVVDAECKPAIVDPEGAHSNLGRSGYRVFGDNSDIIFQLKDQHYLFRPFASTERGLIRARFLLHSE